MGDNESRAIELVDQGAPVNSVNRDGVPILFISGGGCLECEGAMPELTRRLLEYGADPQVSVGRGLQAIHWVVRSGAGGRPGARETVELLLAYGADINAETETGIRPIDFVIQLANASSESGDLEGLVTAERWKEFLMARGARPSNPR